MVGRGIKAKQIPFGMFPLCWPYPTIQCVCVRLLCMYFCFPVESVLFYSALKLVLTCHVFFGKSAVVPGPIPITVLAKGDSITECTRSNDVIQQ